MTFFQHLNQACPPSLSQMVRLKTGNNSDLMSCPENLVPVKEVLSTPRVQVNILDGAAIINMLRPGTVRAFQRYVTEVFVPYVPSQFQHVEGLDFIWVLYIADNLKADTRRRRGKGVRRRVEPTRGVPKTGKSFSAPTTARRSRSLSGVYSGRPRDQQASHHYTRHWSSLLQMPRHVSCSTNHR